MFKPWRVTAIVSVLQFLLGIGMYWWFGSVAIAAATVGFVTLCSLLPVVEGAFPRYCEMMEQIVGVAMFAAFAIAIGAVAVRFSQRADSYLGGGFFAIVAILIVAFLLMITALVLVLIIAGDHKKFEEVPESLSVSIACLLPAGIGLLFGSYYFLVYRGWQKFRELVGWI